jgi:hypothetical protein
VFKHWRHGQPKLLKLPSAAREKVNLFSLSPGPARLGNLCDDPQDRVNLIILLIVNTTLPCISLSLRGKYDSLVDFHGLLETDMTGQASYADGCVFITIGSWMKCCGWPLRSFDFSKP